MIVFRQGMTIDIPCLFICLKVLSASNSIKKADEAALRGRG